MAFDRPTLSELIARVKKDFENRLQTKGPTLTKSFVAIIARVIAGITHLVYGHLVYITRQLFADTAEVDFLERIGSIWGLTRESATFANGEVTITGDDGTIIPAGTVLQRSDGVKFDTDTEVTISGGSVTVNVTAQEAGTGGNTDASTVLTFESPVAGADSSVTVGSEGIESGTDEESDDDFRERIVARIQTPPQGGAEADYVTWSKEVTGVTRAWVTPSIQGEGTVGVTFVRDNDDDIIPTSGEVLDVSAYIVEKRPVTALPIVFAPTGDPINFDISLTPDTTDVREAVEDELRDLIFRDSEPGGTILLSRMRESISIAQGESDNTLNFPSADFTSPTGFLPTFGSVSWS